MKNKIDILKIEKEEIQELFERLNSLDSFVGTLAQAELDVDEQNWLCEKLVRDRTETRIKYEAWWTKMCEKYGLDRHKTENYYVDFIDDYIGINE